MYLGVIFRAPAASVGARGRHDHELQRNAHVDIRRFREGSTGETYDVLRTPVAAADTTYRYSIDFVYFAQSVSLATLLRNVRDVPQDGIVAVSSWRRSFHSFGGFRRLAICERVGRTANFVPNNAFDVDAAR